MKLVHLGCSKTQTSQSIRLSKMKTHAWSPAICPSRALLQPNRLSLPFLNQRLKPLHLYLTPTSIQNAGNTLNDLKRNLSESFPFDWIPRNNENMPITQNFPPCQLSPFAKKLWPSCWWLANWVEGCTQEANKALNLRARPKKIFVKYMIIWSLIQFSYLCFWLCLYVLEIRRIKLQKQVSLVFGKECYDFGELNLC